MGERKLIDVNFLVADEKNPRFEAVSTEDDALFSILEDQSLASGNKILNLAQDIASNGLNASELLVVSPIEGTNTYRVREGNRRVTAIKLALQSGLVPSPFKNLTEQFSSLKKAMEQHRLVECYVSDNEEEIGRLLVLRHGGESEGVGTVKWNSAQRARFSQKGNQQSARAISLVENLQKLRGFDNILAVAANIPATNLGRLISTPEVRQALNIEVYGSSARYLGGRDGLLLAVLEKVKREGVAPIYSKPDRIRLIEETARRVGSDNPEQPQLLLDKSIEVVDEMENGSREDESSRTSRSGTASLGELKNGPHRSDSHGETTAPRRKPVSRINHDAMFGQILRPKGRTSNDVYRAIEWIDRQYLRNPEDLSHLLPILGFSLRLLMETTAREYYDSIGIDQGESAFKNFMKDVAKPAIKAKIDTVEQNNMALASEWIDGKFSFEALFHKWAHGTISVDRPSLVRQSKLVALIISEVWT